VVDDSLVLAISVRPHLRLPATAVRVTCQSRRDWPGEPSRCERRLWRPELLVASAIVRFRRSHNYRNHATFPVNTGAGCDTGPVCRLFVCSPPRSSRCVPALIPVSLMVPRVTVINGIGWIQMVRLRQKPKISGSETRVIGNSELRRRGHR